ncbi:hypothetical protein U1Q18_043650 [Sarracenia purpurea var. burkii]
MRDTAASGIRSGEEGEKVGGEMGGKEAGNGDVRMEFLDVREGFCGGVVAQEGFGALGPGGAEELLGFGYGLRRAAIHEFRKCSRAPR